MYRVRDHKTGEVESRVGLPAGEHGEFVQVADNPYVRAIAAGVQIGDRVAIMARTRFEWTILDFAIWFAGGVTVPIYETSSAEQVDWIVNDSHCVAIIVETPQLRDLVTPILPNFTKNVWTMTENVLAQLAYLGRDISDAEIDKRRNALTPEDRKSTRLNSSH